VVHTTEQLIGGHSFFSLDSGRSVDGRVADLGFGDLAVLYRTDAQADALVVAFDRSGIPYQRHGHGRLMELPAVRALAESLHEKPGVGSLTRRLKLRAKKIAGRPDAVEHGYGLAQMTAALTQVAGLAERCADDTELFLAQLNLGAQQDNWDPRADRVSLLTLHAAKGLEFDVVFMVGCEDGILPLRFGPKQAADLEEERRLFYVGMTRARLRLVLSRAEKRVWQGKTRKLAPSPYLLDLQAELTERIEGRGPKRKRKRGGHQMGLL
jgi:DNA helicase-2/ATP-dependent DNA helicase PcrA